MSKKKKKNIKSVIHHLLKDLKIWEKFSKESKKRGKMNEKEKKC